MKKNGFTLIELLGVLILLAVIALITFPIIDKVLSNAKNEAYERQKDSIIEAARLYVTTNGNYSTSQTQLSFQTLIDSGFLKEGEILDPRDSTKEMPGCVIYNWSESKNQYMFEYSEDCSLPSYAVGDLLKVQVSNNETQNIYVLEVKEDEIIGILDRNITGAIDYDEVNYILNELKNAWNYMKYERLPDMNELIVLTDFYKNLDNKDNWENEYTEVMNNLEIPMYDYYEEFLGYVTELNAQNILPPEWLYANLMITGSCSCDSMKYWTSSPENGSFSHGDTWVVSSGFFDAAFKSNRSYNIGVRPVIAFTSEYIIEKLDKPIYISDELCSIRLCDS